MRTQFYVALFHGINDSTPFTTLPIMAKMPLSALVFALKQARVNRVARVVVAWEEEGQADFHYETDFYNVVMGRTQLKYDRMVEVRSAQESGEKTGDAHNRHRPGE
jgi:mannose-6-phosphate isomerase-like protein (cupin superfamily)